MKKIFLYLSPTTIISNFYSTIHTATMLFKHCMCVCVRIISQFPKKLVTYNIGNCEQLTMIPIEDLINSYQTLARDPPNIYSFYIFLALRGNLTFKRSEATRINSIFKRKYQESISFFYILIE